MAAPFFVGWLAEGTGAGFAFTENTTSGYARQPVIMAGVANGQTALAAGVTFAGATAAFVVTQRAFYDQATGGNLLAFWNLGAPVAVAAGGTDTLAAGRLVQTYPALNPLPAAEVLFPPGALMGLTADGLPITAGVAVAVSSAGVFSANPTAGVGAGADASGAQPASLTALATFTVANPGAYYVQNQSAGTLQVIYSNGAGGTPSIQLLAPGVGANAQGADTAPALAWFTGQITVAGPLGAQFMARHN